MSRALLQQAAEIIANAKLANPEDIEIINAIYIELEKPERQSVACASCGGTRVYMPPQPKPLTPSEWWDAAPWQPMETAPKDRNTILLKDAKGYMDVSWWDDTDDCWSTGIGEFNIPIAWLPLPDTEQK